MDTVSSSFLPNAPLILDMSAFSKNQQTLLSITLRRMSLIIDPHNTKNITNHKWTKEDVTNETSFLLEILTILTAHFPSSVKDIAKTQDQLLNNKINKFFKKLVELFNTINKWEENLNTKIEVFETTLPHSLEHSQTLQDLGSDYASLTLSELDQIQKERDSLILEIQQRVETFQERKISTGSLTLLVNAHDIDLTSLEMNIQNYRERTENFKSTKVEVEKKFQQMTQACKSFEKSFCLLNYVIINNCLCNTINKSIFLSGYTCGLYGMPSYSASNFKLFQEQPVTSLKINMKELTKKQISIIQNIFNIIYQKHHLLNVEKPIEPCNDIFLYPLLEITSEWVPFGNNKKTELDKILIYDVNQLIIIIDSTAIKFKNLEEKYLENIKRLPFLANDEREVDKKAYVTLSRTLSNLSKDKKKLDERLKQRIILDVKKKISPTTLKIICNSHDIKMERLEKNLRDFHKTTEQCAFYFNSVAEKTEIMNQNIKNYCKAINYFSYLYENKLTDKGVDYYFNTWYALGYYNFIHEGKFKTPPKDELPLPWTEDEDKQESLGYNHFTDVSGDEGPYIDYDALISPFEKDSESDRDF